MWNLLDKYRPVYGLADAAGGGGGDPAPGSDPAASGGGDGGFKLPDGFPDAFKGASADEALSKLLGGYNEVNTRAEGLRTKLAGLPKPPEKPDQYVYDPSEKLKPYFGDTKGNPTLDLAKQAFHKHGIPQSAFAGVIEDLYGPMIEKGLLPPPFDAKAELKSFSTELGLDAAGATKALTETDAFAKGLMAQLKDVPTKLKADVEAQLLGLTDTAAGNVLLRALAGRLGENGIRIAGDAVSSGPLSPDDVKKLTADPRIDPRNENHADINVRFDPVLRKRYDDHFAKLAG